MKNTKLLNARPFVFSSANIHTHQEPLKNPIYPPINEYLFHSTATNLSSALQHYINSDTPFHGQKIHTRILKSGFVPNTNISIKLLILYLKCGCLKYARQMFDELPQPTLSAYNYMVGGYLKQGLVQESMCLVHRLVLDGQRPDGFTYSMILKASTSGENVTLCHKLGSVVHGQIVKLDVASDDVLFTALVDSYVKSGRVGYARKVFDMMMEKNVICSTSLISGYMNQGSIEVAEENFKKMVEKDFEPLDVVDAFHRDGWWKAVVTKVDVFDYNESNSKKYIVIFEDPPEQFQFSSTDLRVHLLDAVQI